MTDLAAELRDRATALAAALDEIAAADDDGVRTWSVGGHLFAVLAEESLELRLDPAVAAAAVRTPDTTASARGADWIRFAPAELDAHAVDRLQAWFALAYRRARL